LQRIAIVVPIPVCQILDLLCAVAALLGEDIAVGIVSKTVVVLL
jgi:hypothetical protein